MDVFMAVVVAAAAARLQGLGGLEPQRLYNGVARPVMIGVPTPSGTGEMTLALMDFKGNPLAPPAAVRPGLVDVAALVPEIWRIPRACFLQLLVADRPAGSALVLQPMRSRLVPIAEEAVNPSGMRYTKIVGWKSEFAQETEPIPPPEPDDGKHAEEVDGQPQVSPPTGDVAMQRRLLSGLRIYPERDVVLHTSKGDIRLAMRPDHAPNTVWNFLNLGEGGFYRDVIFHRVVPFTRAGDPFVIQAGDPTGTGTGGPGFWLPIEPSRLPHDFGVISMARDMPPDSAGSQFFICLSRRGTARLDGHYCAFGYAVEGAEVIRAIAAVELTAVASQRPAHPPVIEAVQLVAAPPRTPGQGRPDRPVAEAINPAETQPQRVPR